MYIARDLYKEYQQSLHESRRDFMIYRTLEKGPSFKSTKKTLSRDTLVNDVKKTSNTE
jgi:hypothetical protein